MANSTSVSPASLAQACLAVLLTANARAKAHMARDIASQWRQGKLTRDRQTPDDWPARPNRPDQPQLLPPRDMPRRKMSGPKGRIAQLHALAHIELNAIDLAFDMAGRFIAADMPDNFIDDWMRVGADEARHFLMLSDRLAELGAAYGDLPAHDGLWQAAYDTRQDLLARLAVVPMVLEARGLDVTPAMMAKFAAAGDDKSANMLNIIYEDEKSHVAIGTKWFLHLCHLRKLDPKNCFGEKVQANFQGRLKPPFNVEARTQAGLPAPFYLDLAVDQGGEAGLWLKKRSKEQGEGHVLPKD